MNLNKIFASDYLLRIPLAAFVGFLLFNSLRHALWLVGRGDYSFLVLAGILANIAFMSTMLCLTVFRSAPVLKSEGMLAKVGAFFGAFLPIAVAALPDAQLPPSLHIVSLVLVITGCVLSLCTVAWLGRSLSLTAQARRLVTTGPYRLVRHPLYVTEEIAVLGIVLANWSMLALAYAAVHWALQLKRMGEEEKILQSAFPEYDEYAAKVPKLIPFSGYPVVPQVYSEPASPT